MTNIMPKSASSPAIIVLLVTIGLLVIAAIARGVSATEYAPAILFLLIGAVGVGAFWFMAHALQEQEADVARQIERAVDDAIRPYAAQQQARDNQIENLKAELERERRACEKAIVEAREERASRRIYEQMVGVFMQGRDGNKLFPLAPALPSPPERIQIVGVWPENARLAQLNLKEDLRQTFENGGDWLYRILEGDVTGEALEREFLVSGNAHILYLAGHATEDGIWFSNKKYPAHWLAEIANRYGVKLVILNMCDTRDIAQKLNARNVQAVIYSLKDLPDDVAISFTRALMFPLALRRSVSESVEIARRAISTVDELAITLVGHVGDWRVGE